MKIIRNFVKEYEAHLDALQNGEPFTPRLTAPTKVKAVNKKRKNTRGDKRGTKKRRHSGTDDEDDSMESGSGSNSDSSNDSDSSFASGRNSDDEDENEDEDETPDSDSDDSEVVEPEVTEEYLERKIKESKENIKAARETLSNARKEKKEATDYLSTLNKNIAKAQKEKNAFCSLKRSEVI